MKSVTRTVCTLRLAVALTVAAGAAASVSAQGVQSPQTTSLKWNSGAIERVRPMSVQQIEQTLGELSDTVESKRILVHLGYQLDQSQKNLLHNSGLNLTTSLGSTSYFATLSPNADIAQIARTGLVSVSQIQLHQKLHIDLQGGLIHPWMLSQDDVQKFTSLRELSDIGVMTNEDLAAQDLNPTVIVVVMLHDDADRAAEGARLAQQFNGEVISQVKSVNSIILAIKPNQIESVASDDSVMWVEPPLPQMSELNASNRVLVGADTLNSNPYNLDGSGVDVMVYDGGQVFGHNDFGSRLTIGASDTDGISNHATHVAGTIGGDGSGNFNNRGMAPGVDIISYGFQQEGGLMEGFLYTDPGDLEADYTEAIVTYGADISNNSIGTNTAPNGYPCDWTGNYGVTSALIDSVARGSVDGPFRIVWANGNERQTTRCFGDDNGNFGEFFSTAPPACAKNHITVGSVDSDTDLTSSFSSWGPTDDGRIKPDISAPGCQAGGDGGVTSTSSSGSYTTLCGTSMASPTTAGISALILEQYRATFPDRNDLMNATLKSLLANSAMDRGEAGPDYKYGYGSIRGVAAIDTVIAENVIESEVAQGGVYRGIIIVGEGETELKVTIAWDDAPAAPNVTTALVNDLDLRIIDAGGTPYLPWTLNPADPGAAAVQNTSDHLNNIEQVAILNPAPGAYTVEVTGFNIAQGPVQTFGLSSSTTLINCSSAGIIGMGGNLFPCDGSTSVQVVDCDLNTSDSVVDTVDVTIDSDASHTGPITLTLVETAPESATFTGSFTFSDLDKGADIHVSEGATLTATYLDLDDGEGNIVSVMASASIDCTAPTLTSTSVSNLEPRSASVDATTDEPTKITVNYGTSVFALNNFVESGSFSNSHSVNINGLTDETSYVYTIDIEDQAGNMSYDDNGGVGYAFTTPDVPDFFTEQFASGLDLEGISLTLTPNGSVDGYAATVLPLDGGILPFEPTNGSALPLSDDDSETVSVTGGNTVSLYGETYTSFSVGSNGYITLGSSDTDYTESLDDHFDLPRISGLFDDLNPSSAGTVYAQQLADRMVVSYDNVTEYSNSNNNTFQIELHFDGTIVISWENIDSSDAICGISKGDGLDPDFLMSDLSTYMAPSTCAADINGDGDLNFFDVSAYLSAFGAADLIADFNGDGELNFFDVSAFVTALNAGCP
ncbi:MAG: S8 family serine peptidase [Phycisphaerales bacterium]|nr:S8 family serine peptidase [Phycisphaerales bacterium]